MASADVDGGAHNADIEAWDGDERTWPDRSFKMCKWRRRHDRQMPQLMRGAVAAPVAPELANMSDELKTIAGKAMIDLARRASSSTLASRAGARWRYLRRARARPVAWACWSS